MSAIKLNNGLKMPFIGLGTWQSSPGEVGEAVKVAISAGYRCIDCAHAYGNEAEIGAALADVFKQGIVRREDLFIVSKLWNTMHHPDDVHPALQKSLDDLQLTYLDLYHIHWPFSYKRGSELFPSDETGKLLLDDSLHYLETWKSLERCVDEGLVKSIGVSNFNSQQIQDIIDNSRIPPAVVQVEIHPFLQQYKLVEFCKQRNIAVTSYSSFTTPAWPDRMVEIPSVFDNETLMSIGRKYGKSAAQVTLRWLHQRNIAVIPKSVTPERIKHNFQIFDFELTDEDVENIKKLNKNLRAVAYYAIVDGKVEMLYTDSKLCPFNIEF